MNHFPFQRSTKTIQHFKRSAAAKIAVLLMTVCLFSSVGSFSSDAANINDPSAESLIEGVSLQRKIVTDTDGLRITAECLTVTKDDPDSPAKVSVLFSVENRSHENVNLMTSSLSCYVNDHHVSGGSQNIDIPRGQTVTLPLISLTASTLAENGIQYIRTVESSFYIRIGESGTGSSQFLNSKFTLETASERTDEPVVPFESTCLYDNGGIKICAVTEKITSQNAGTLFFVRVENHSGQYLEAKAPLSIVENGSLKEVIGPNRYSSLSLPDGKIETLVYFPQLSSQLSTSDVRQFELKVQADLFEPSDYENPVKSMELGPYRIQY